MEMEYISLVDTSLDLNANPLRLFDDVQINKEVESNFMELGRKMPMKEEPSALVEELNRVNEENKKLTEMLTVLCENYNTLRSQLMDYTSKNPPGSTDINMVVSRKRKVEISNNGGTNIINGGNINSDQTSSSSDHQDSSCKKLKEDEHAKSKISRVYVRTQASDTSLIVKDGYQWRKYGQKVTRDNPSPRAYFKCSFAPTCPVKKKVQRSVEDQSVLVATYEGEHNHPNPSRSVESTSTTTSSSRGGTMTLLGSSGPSITTTIDHHTKIPYSQPNHATTTTTTGTDDKIPSSVTIKSPEFQQFLVEQMATSLTKDPGFKAALAAAISGRFLQQNNNQIEKW